jgi:hypothetical protein
MGRREPKLRLGNRPKDRDLDPPLQYARQSQAPAAGSRLCRLQKRESQQTRQQQRRRPPASAAASSQVEGGQGGAAGRRSCSAPPPAVLHRRGGGPVGGRGSRGQERETALYMCEQLSTTAPVQGCTHRRLGQWRCRRRSSSCCDEPRRFDARPCLLCCGTRVNCECNVAPRAERHSARPRRDD